MSGRIEKDLLTREAVNAVRANPGLSSIKDITSVLGKDSAVDRELLGNLIQTVLKRVPDLVRESGVRNNRGATLYAPVDREPSAREQRVGSRNPLVRSLSRVWYVGIQRIKTCDL